MAGWPESSVHAGFGAAVESKRPGLRPRPFQLDWDLVHCSVNLVDESLPLPHEAEVEVIRIVLLAD